MEDGVSGGAYGTFETEALAHSAADDRLARTKVTEQCNLVPRLQAFTKLNRPVKCIFFRFECHYLKFVLELLVSELVQQMELALLVEFADAGMAYTVEECGFHHCIMDHVFKDDAVADL